MKKSAIFSLLCGVIIFIIAFALFCPNLKITLTNTSGNIQYIAPPSSGTMATPGEILDNGKITLSPNGAAVVEFPIEKSCDIKSIKITYKEPVKSTLDFYVELTVDGSFKDVSPVLTHISKGQDFCCLEVNPAKYTAVRVWFWQDCVLQNVSFYDGSLVSEIKDNKTSPIRYFAAAVVVLFGTVLSFILDFKLKISEKITALIKKHYLRITLFICGVGLSIALGFIAEIVFRLIIGPDSLGNNFSAVSCACFSAVFVCLFAVFFERKSVGEKPEKLVLTMILTIGTMVILTQPAGHNCWDLDSHYPLSLENSYIKTANYTQADLGIKFNTMFSTVTDTAEKSESVKQALNSAGEAAVSQTDVRIKITHLPSGVFIAVARMLGVSFYTQYMCGQFANLLLYAIIVYFAIKKLKSGKMVACTIAMFPTNIFIASNYSYDHWVTAFVLLGTCYFVSECEQPDKPISAWETIVMCGAFAIGSLPKQIYILLMGLLFFIKKRWVDKKSRRNYYLILLACFAAVFAMLVLRSMGAVSAGSAGDIRGGEVNPSEQLKYILSQPFNYARILIKFLLDYLSPSAMSGYISSLAYLGKGKLTIVFQIILVFAMFTGKNGERYRCTWWTRVLAVLMYIGISALTATALYIDFTPLKSDVILGCQSRYIVPLLAPVALTLFGSGIKVFKNKTIYNTCILCLLCAATLYEFISLVSIPMM